MPSSVIAAFDYDAPSRALAIRFVSGRRYVYRDVPSTVAQALARAPSKGSYFNRRIRDRFRYTRERSSRD
ncbi:MAG: KTSC domain-containing protein [Sphingomonadaceae bacterium]|nr:KTSC domain-containing protein [Sphingomonadaceae bacterium]